MNKEQFVAEYIAKHQGTGRKRMSVAEASAAAEKEWARMQDTAYALKTALLARTDSKYWCAADGSKGRIYFNKVGAFFDCVSNEWMIETPAGAIKDVDGKSAMALGI